MRKKRGRKLAKEVALKGKKLSRKHAKVRKSRRITSSLSSEQSGPEEPPPESEEEVSDEDWELITVH